jgi:YVTN family beta-propeller protein
MGALRTSILLLSLLAAGPTKAGADEKPQGASFDEKGLRVEFSIRGVPGPDGAARPIVEGRDAEVAFRVSDAATGAPVSPLKPAVWIDLLKGEEAVAGKPNLACKDRVSRYLQGSLSFQPDVNLNKFFILVMNNDHSISVIDPIVDAGGVTQLYTMILLKGRGEDWVASLDGKRLFVTMPKAGELAAVDLENFKVLKSAEAGANPVRVALQPDGKYLWVGNDGPAGGVTVLDAATLAVAARIPTGAGRHEIAFAETSLFAYVTNSEAGTVSVVDTQQLAKLADLPVGDRPVGIAFSPLARAVYVASQGGGVAVIDVAKNRVVARIDTAPGLAALRFAPGGRWGFVANASRDEVLVLDASSGSIAHTFKVGAQPMSFTFTATFAYVRCGGTAEATLIRLAELDTSTSLATSTVALGTRAPGGYALPAAADAFAPTGEWDTLLAANPLDGLIYYYMEGMVAPMGTFQAYGRVPRAVRVVDRSLREIEKGVYASRFRVPMSGKYDVAMVIDSPWVYHCFEFTAAADPKLAGARQALPPKIERLEPGLRFTAGQPARLRFSLRQHPGGAPLTGVADVVVLAAQVPGNWQERRLALPGADGTYEVVFTPEHPGRHTVFFEIPSRNLEFSQFPTFTLEVTGSTAPEMPR